MTDAAPLMALLGAFAVFLITGSTAEALLEQGKTRTGILVALSGTLVLFGILAFLLKAAL